MPKALVGGPVIAKKGPSTPFAQSSGGATIRSYRSADWSQKTTAGTAEYLAQIAGTQVYRMSR